MNSVLLDKLIDEEIYSIDKYYFKPDFFSEYYCLQASYEAKTDFDISNIDNRINLFINSNPSLRKKEFIYFLQKLADNFIEHYSDLRNILNEITDKTISKQGKGFFYDLDKIIAFVQAEIEEVNEHYTFEEYLKTKESYNNEPSNNDENPYETIQVNSEEKALTSKEKKNKIQINSEINNMAYLFFTLRKNKIIECQNLGKALSELFLNEEGKPIQNDLFNSYFNKFADNENPSKATIIDSFVKDFKKV